jgi:hypothetical protein
MPKNLRTKWQQQHGEAPPEALTSPLTHVDPWDGKTILGVSSGVWEPIWSRQHVEKRVEPKKVDVSPPIKTGEMLDHHFVEMFISGSQDKSKRSVDYDDREGLVPV